MKMKRILLALTCIFLLSTCKKEDPKQPELPETPVTASSALSGKVSHYDQFGNRYTTNLNTTTVTIEGKNFTAITDTSGIYRLNGVPSNTYTLVFKKPGCGLIKRESIIFKAGDTTTYNSSVADIPVFTINSAYVKDTNWFAATLGGIYYNASSSPVNSKATVVAIIGKNQNLDIANPSSYLNYATASLLSVTDFNRFFSYPLLKDSYTFKKDSILYMKVYPVSTTGAGYFSNGLSTMIYTAYGTPYPTLFSLYVH